MNERFAFLMSKSSDQMSETASFEFPTNTGRVAFSINEYKLSDIETAPNQYIVTILHEHDPNDEDICFYLSKKGLTDMTHLMRSLADYIDQNRRTGLNIPLREEEGDSY
jgi:hypothetical protein